MSVSGEGAVQRRQWGGEDDPRYPTGMWVARGSVTGDVSGGTARVSLRFQEVGAAALDSKLYSIEELAVSNTDGIEETGHIQSLNMGEVSGDQVWAVEMLAVPSPVDSAMSMRDASLFRRIFLGSQVTVGTISSLDLVLVNTNLAVIRFFAGGYIWGARSRSVPGGPKVPPDVLFRA